MNAEGEEKQRDWETAAFVLVHVIQAILLVAVLFLVLWSLSGGSV